MPPTMALLLVGLARTHVSHVYPLLKATLLKRYNPDVFLAMSTEMGCPSAQRAVPPGNAKPMDARGRALLGSVIQPGVKSQFTRPRANRYRPDARRRRKWEIGKLF